MLTEVHVPDGTAAVVGLMATGARVLAGGTSLMPSLNDHASPETELISLRRAGLGGIRVDGGVVRLGAAATLSRIERDARLAVLRPVVRSIASVPVRTLATAGGNLFARRPHGDLTVALVALDARVTLADSGGTHELPVEDLLAGTAPPALVTEIVFGLPAAGSFRYLKASRRRFNSASLVTVAATVTEVDGVVSAARVALGGVGPGVVRAVAVERALIGSPLDVPAVRRAAEAGLGEISPADDAYASAWYRARVFPVHLRRALLGH
ncbi:FAD binding domain-containing protein [Actinocorallia longicatena]|uniref:FAD binding domain-containing protein n=1 Tax=Actinocorallia longicatena TaxID=111803 RepID=A0ABP6QA50_9ACTN